MTEATTDTEARIIDMADLADRFRLAWATADAAGFQGRRVEHALIQVVPIVLERAADLLSGTEVETPPLSAQATEQDRYILEGIIESANASLYADVAGLRYLASVIREYGDA